VSVEEVDEVDVDTGSDEVEFVELDVVELGVVVEVVEDVDDVEVVVGPAE
jgi:hypothetical protein